MLILWYNLLQYMAINLNEWHFPVAVIIDGKARIQSYGNLTAWLADNKNVLIKYMKKWVCAQSKVVQIISIKAYIICGGEI